MEQRAGRGEAVLHRGCLRLHGEALKLQERSGREAMRIEPRAAAALSSEGAACAPVDGRATATATTAASRGLSERAVAPGRHGG